MPKVNQKGVAHLFLLILILAGIALGVYLINQKTQLFPFAASNPIPGPSDPNQSFGKAIKFQNESSDNAYLTIKPLNHTSVAPAAFTLEGWVKVPKPSSGSSIRDYSLVTYTKPLAFLDKGYLARLSVETQEGNGESRPMFEMLLDNWTDSSNSHLAYISVGSGNSTSFHADKWTHLAVTASASGNTCVMKLYLDGSLVDSNTRVVNPTCKFSAQSAGELLVAKPPAGLSGISGYYFPGFMDELRFSMEVLYNSNFIPAKAPFNSTYSGPAALFHFDGNINDSGYYHHFSESAGSISYVDSTIGSLNPNPSSSAISGPVDPHPSQYTLEARPGLNIQFPTSSANTGFGIGVTLKQNGSVVADQSDFNFTWTVGDSTIVKSEPWASNGDCGFGIQSPCPLTQSDLKGLKAGSTNIKVEAIQKSTNKKVAEVLFNITITKPGDADGDNDVDIFDYNLVLTHFGIKNQPGNVADFDKDGDVDIFDYNIILTYFGT